MEEQGVRIADFGCLLGKEEHKNHTYFQAGETFVDFACT